MTPFWYQDRLSVKVGYNKDGSLTFSAYDRNDNNDNNDYEYDNTVAAAELAEWDAEP